MYYDDSGLVV